MRETNVCFELCVTPVLTQNPDIRNFHGSLTLNNGKLIRYFRSPWYAIVSNMTHFFIQFAMREKKPFLNYVFYLYWRKINAFRIFMGQWLQINGNQFDISEAVGMPLSQIAHFDYIAYFLLYK